MRTLSNISIGVALFFTGAALAQEQQVIEEMIVVGTHIKGADVAGSLG